MNNLLAASFKIDKNVFPPAGRFDSVGQLASDIVLILTSVAGAVSIIFIIIGGIKIIMASGDPKELSQARQTILYAIIGLAVTVLAFVIVRAVQFFLRSSVPIS